MLKNMEGAMHGGPVSNNNNNCSGGSSGSKAASQHQKRQLVSHADASTMLEAALQQMDGIISGAATSGGVSNTEVTSVKCVISGAGGESGLATQSSGTSPTTVSGSGRSAISEHNLISAANVLSTAKTLALALQQVGVAAPAPDPTTATIINDWLSAHLPRQDADESLRRLQRDKESLALQYQMVADRVAEQADKIFELEGLLTEKSQQLSIKEEQLSRQMLSRSTLETQKLELMTALSELKLHRAALERENVELKGDILVTHIDNGNIRRQHILPFGSMGHLNQIGPSGVAPKTPPPSLRHQIHSQFHSLPRAHASRNSINNSPSKSNNNNNNIRILDANVKQRNVAFASNEKILIEDTSDNAMSSSVATDLMYSSFASQSPTTNSTPSPNLRDRAKGLRNIFGKLRRSNSGNLELPTALEIAEPEFKRGGARATAGGRIEWTTQSSNLSLTAASKDYTDWTPHEVAIWLCDLGLQCYEDDCRKWLKANPSISFFTASPVDIERELNIKNALHRKKIQLARAELTGKEEDTLALKAAQLDVGWVMRWLDDIGLPQYKDTFLLAKMDGRMLHRLTMEDLVQLHVNSYLHIASLRCAIQCMREMDWNPECLIRRSTKSERNTSESSDVIEAAVDDNLNEYIGLWTAHRVMEWLRVADLSEYAPNLRGAGVHGALMLHEPRFNADLLADLLSIPPSKTLLRRHLATHFKELLGRDIIQGKRDAEAAPGYQPLTITAKLKMPKKMQFSLKRRKSAKGTTTDIDWSDYVCPMAISSCLRSSGVAARVNEVDKKYEQEENIPQQHSGSNSSPKL